jgi:hypothetical protein
VNVGRLRCLVSATGITANVFRTERSAARSDGTTGMMPLPALGVRPRTVGDFCGRQFMGKAASAFRQRLSMEMGGCCALIG